MKTFKYEVQKRMEIAGSHQLKLPYSSKCENLHGHNWIVTVYVGTDEKQDDMVLDFTHIKKSIHDKLDHQHLNDILDFNPTAENIAEWIAHEVDNMKKGVCCFKVTVQESEGNIATYNNIDC